jgi:hypothetical protein
MDPLPRPASIKPLGNNKPAATNPPDHDLPCGMIPSCAFRQIKYVFLPF